MGTGSGTPLEHDFSDKDNNCCFGEGLADGSIDGGGLRLPLLLEKDAVDK
jgi:hypothetical protein